MSSGSQTLLSDSMGTRLPANSPLVTVGAPNAVVASAREGLHHPREQVIVRIGRGRKASTYGPSPTGMFKGPS